MYFLLSNLITLCLIASFIYCVGTLCVCNSGHSLMPQCLQWLYFAFVCNASTHICSHIFKCAYSMWCLLPNHCEFHSTCATLWKPCTVTVCIALDEGVPSPSSHVRLVTSVDSLTGLFCVEYKSYQGIFPPTTVCSFCLIWSFVVCLLFVCQPFMHSQNHFPSYT